MRFYNRISFKLSLLSSLLVLGVIGLMAHKIIEGARDGFIAEMRVRAETFGRSCREAIFPKVDPFVLHFTVEEIVKEKGVVYAAVLDKSGKVLSHSVPSRVGERDSSAEAKAALASDTLLLQSWTSGEDHQQYFDFAVPVTVRAQRVGTVRMGFTRASVEEALAKTRWQILVMSALAILIAVIGTVLIVHRITAPLPMLAAAARDIGRGKLDSQVPWRSRDEIGVLARAFNEMAVANHLAFMALTEEKEKLSTLFSEAKDAMMLTDPSGRILLANPHAQRLMGYGESAITPPGGPPKNVKDAFARFQVTPSADTLLTASEDQHAFELLRKEPRLLILAGTRDRVSAGYLWVFRDATSEKKEEVLSRSILSLMSHKMRTPLMASLGYLDILHKELKVDGFHKKAFESLIVQQQKLNAMVDKLLFFATVHSPELLVLDRKLVPLRKLVEGACKTLEAFSEQHKADIVFDVKALDKLPEIEADPMRLQESIRNLVENGVKFNPKDNKKVEISAEQENSAVRIAVVDNGPGIPEEELPKLFQKFYQVEEGFTGQTDGMGLGLAYVKNVMDAHGGKAGIKSSLGRGCEFWLLIPVKAVLKPGTPEATRAKKT